MRCLFRLGYWSLKQHSILHQKSQLHCVGRYLLILLLVLLHVNVRYEQLFIVADVLMRWIELLGPLVSRQFSSGWPISRDTKSLFTSLTSSGKPCRLFSRKNFPATTKAFYKINYSDELTSSQTISYFLCMFSDKSFFLFN